MNNPEEVKELSKFWPSTHSNLYNLIHKKELGAWERTYAIVL